MAQRLLYMLIEEDDRELSSRSLLAAIAIECGFNVVFVPQWTVWQNWEAMPQGLMFFKGNNKAQAVQMREAKAHGHIVASIEEEALGISDCREVLRCFDERIARYCDLFLANGLFEADCIGREFPSVTDRISVTGNPRTDLLREEFAGDLRTQADAICAEHGEFMLVNTNFSTINPRGDDALGGFDSCVRVGLVNQRDDQDIQDFFTWCAWEKVNVSAVGELMSGLCDRLPWPVIIRPHPTEDLDVWHEVFDDWQGVQIIREGGHLAWTAAASILVHPGCTTGVEALLLGTPALSIVVDDNPWHWINLSNLVNPIATDIPSAIETIEAFARGDDRISPRRNEMLERLSRHVHYQPSRLCSQIVAEALDGLDVKPVEANVLGKFAKVRMVDPTDGKIDPDRFNPIAVAGMVNGFRRSLGLVGCAKVCAAGPDLLLCGLSELAT
ncbi:MAG: hypothetical protein CMM47_02520 [Rhodospirillaceae bacterium]|nr:hypothetical protein [Rhodospirillaceae bacterium]